MDVAEFRDWIIIVLGLLEIILVVGLIIVLLIIYSRINRIIKKGKEIVTKIEKVVTSPYFKTGSLLFSGIAAGLGLFQKRKS